MAKIKVTQIKSRNNRLKEHRATLDALGLKKMGASRIHEANPSILGMCKAVEHLVKVEEIEG